MYIPKHFAESDSDLLYEFIRGNPFALLVTNTQSGLNADHLPVYLNTQNPHKVCIQGHIASANPLWKNITGLQQSLLIFQGSNAYISPSWLPSKKTDGRVVPTWNYSAVHVKGCIEFIHDPSWKLALLNNLTAQQENKLEYPWLVADAPEEYIQKLLPAIVGFEVVVSEVMGKFKLSQNQSTENQTGIAEGLEQQHPLMAEQIFSRLNRK